MLRFLGGEGSSLHLETDQQGRFLSRLTVRAVVEVVVKVKVEVVLELEVEVMSCPRWSPWSGTRAGPTGASPAPGPPPW